MALDIGLLHSEHILHCAYNQNSKNAAKPRNQRFSDRKVEKIPKKNHGGPIYPKFTVSGFKYSQHPYNFSF